ncbi:MAG: hypothetical protein ACC682_00530 [Gemmatimonadota bacterium]
MKSRAMIGLLASVLFVSPLHAQDDLARVRSRYDATTLAQLELIIKDAENDGVPRSLLVEKALEGVAKRMPEEVVVDAVDVWADELRAAVALLGRGTEPAGLAKVAESIRHGVDSEVIRRLAGDYPADYPIMLQTIDDFVHAGVEFEEAEAMVTDAAERGFRGEDVLTMSAILRRLVREGTSPVDAAASIRLNMRRGGFPIPPSPPPGGSEFPTRTGVGRVIPPPPPPPPLPPLPSEPT